MVSNGEQHVMVKWRTEDLERSEACHARASTTWGLGSNDPPPRTPRFAVLVRVVLQCCACYFLRTFYFLSLRVVRALIPFLCTGSIFFFFFFRFLVLSRFLCSLCDSRAVHRRRQGTFPMPRTQSLVVVPSASETTRSLHYHFGLHK